MKNKTQHGVALRLLLFLGVTLFIYWPAMQGGFIFDDFPRILENGDLAKPLPATFLLTEARAVGQLSLVFNRHFNGANPFGYRLFNLIVHLLAGLALLGWLQGTFRCMQSKKGYEKPSEGTAWVITGLWLLHPLQTQSVSYIIQRHEALMGLFYFSTFYFFVKGIQSKASPYRWFFLAILSSALGMKSKEVMVSAPFMLLLFDRIFSASSWKNLIQKRFWVHVGFLLTLLLLLGPLKYSVTTAHSAGFAFKVITPLQYAATQPSVILHYLKQILWPTSLVFDYGWPPEIRASVIVISVAALAGIFVFISILIFKKIKTAYFLIWFFVTLAPTSSIMPISDIAVEHRLYVPLLGVIAFAVLAIDMCWLNLRQTNMYFSKLGKDGVNYTLCFIVLIMLALAFLTYKRNTLYASELSLWQDTVRKRPQNFRAISNLGIAYGRLGLHDQALQEFERAIEINPEYDIPYYNMGSVAVIQNKPEQAIKLYQRFLELSPNDINANIILGNIYFEKKQFFQAVECYTKALNQDVSQINVRLNLALAYYELEDWAHSDYHFKKILERDSAFVPAYNGLGSIALAQQQYEKAIVYYRAGLAISSNDRLLMQNLRAAEKRGQSP